MKGTVMKSTGALYLVLGEDDKPYTCRVRGKLRLAGYKESNPVAVGEYVEFEPEGSEGSITEVLPRKNHILRKAAKKSAQTHVLAANIDQALIVVTMSVPRTSTGFIDRFLVTAEAHEIPQLIVFNKQDLLNDELLATQESLINYYESLSIRCFRTIALSASNPELQEALAGKTTLLTGHSGTGKSTLLNSLSPDIGQKTGAVSQFNEKGIHTTTFAEMFRLDYSTFVIDTPGIKEWGLAGITPEELSDHFPEMRDLRADCKFGYSCKHLEEPGCAVLEAVETGTILLSRYENYLSMAFGEDNRR